MSVGSRSALPPVATQASGASQTSVAKTITATSLPSLNGEVELKREKFLAQAKKNKPDVPPGLYGCLKHASAKIVESMAFRHALSCAILMNVVELGTSTDILEEPWKDVWNIFDNLFAFFFALEMVLKLLAWGPKKYFNNRMNVFDFMLAWVGMLDMWVLHMFFRDDDSLGMLGVLRIFRLLRLLRVLKVLTIQRQLLVVIEGIMASLSSMFWIGLLLTVIIYMFAIFCVVMVGRADRSHPNKEQLFGNIPRSMLSLFNMTLLTEWPTIVWPLFEEQAWIVPIFVVFVIFASCGVLNVIIGVIVERTNEAGSKMREEDVRKYKQKQLEMACMLGDIMEELDENKDRKLSFEELMNGMSGEHSGLTELLNGMDMPSGFTLWHLFTMLDEDADCHLSHKEFIEGMRRLIFSNEFHRFSMVQCSVHQMKRQIRRVQGNVLKQVRESTQEVLRELRCVQQHLGIEAVGGFEDASKRQASMKSCASMASMASMDMAAYDSIVMESAPVIGPTCLDDCYTIRGLKLSPNPRSAWDPLTQIVQSAKHQPVQHEVVSAPIGHGMVHGVGKSASSSSTAPMATLMAVPPLPPEPLKSKSGGEGDSSFSRTVRFAARKPTAVVAVQQQQQQQQQLQQLQEQQQPLRQLQQLQQQPVQPLQLLQQQQMQQQLQQLQEVALRPQTPTPQLDQMKQQLQQRLAQSTALQPQPPPQQYEHSSQQLQQRPAQHGPLQAAQEQPQVPPMSREAPGHTTLKVSGPQVPSQANEDTLPALSAGMVALTTDQVAPASSASASTAMPESQRSAPSSRLADPLVGHYMAQDTLAEDEEVDAGLLRDACERQLRGE